MTETFGGGCDDRDNNRGGIWRGGNRSGSGRGEGGDWGGVREMICYDSHGFIIIIAFFHVDNNG